MASTTNVNVNSIINNPPVSYFHCYKINNINYAMFDVKMDMPIVIGSYAIIKSTKLPQNSVVWSYDISKKGYFEKVPEKTIEIQGDGKHTKAPLRYNYIDKKNLIYHHFKLSNILYVLWDERFDMPIAYGSSQRIQAVVNQIPKTSTIYYYKEDLAVKNSFKFYYAYDGKKSH